MSSLKDTKRRIRSVKNTSQITKAMEVVSATKMRKSQAVALAGRPYALASLDILKNISRRTADASPLLAARPVAHTLICAVTSDKGLAGALNANVLRLCEKWLKESGSGLFAPPDLQSKSGLALKEYKEHKGDREDVVVATVGKKAREYFSRRGTEPVRAFTGFGDFIERKETADLAEFLLTGYRQNRWDRVLVFYTNFRTTLKQEPKMVEVLPIHIEKIEEAIKGIAPEYGRFGESITHLPSKVFKENLGWQEPQSTIYRYDYKFEPSPDAVLEKLIPVLFAIQIHHIILESNASEHSARMVAMKNASESAQDLIGELTIEYNKSRQAGITRELTEITAGREALER